MKLVITTQVLENYGAHEWDGVGICPQDWKAKGGDVYVVQNLTSDQVLRIKETGIPTLQSLIEVSNDGFREYVAGSAIMDDDAVVCDPWETPFILSYEGGRWVARRTTENDQYSFMNRLVDRKIEEYDMGPAGTRANYSVVYVMRNGDIVKGSDVSEYLARMALATTTA